MSKRSLSPLPAPPAPAHVPPLVYGTAGGNAQTRLLSDHDASWFPLDGRWWPTVLHVYAAHALGADEWSDKLSTAVPGAPCALGNDPWYAWDALESGQVRVGFRRNEVLERALRAKFRVPSCRDALLATHPRALRHVSRIPDAAWSCTVRAGVVCGGQNRHGQLLMRIRDELRADRAAKEACEEEKLKADAARDQVSVDEAREMRDMFAWPTDVAAQNGQFILVDWTDDSAQFIGCRPAGVPIKRYMQIVDWANETDFVAVPTCHHTQSSVFDARLLPRSNFLWDHRGGWTEAKFDEAQQRVLCHSHPRVEFLPLP